MAILTTNVKTANVKFLNGLQSDLNTLITNGGATKGAFYLTSDTHRLYIGQEDNNRNNLVVPVPVNEGVTTVANVNSLPSISGPNSGEAGNFYYAAAENILCVYNGNQWVQINPDTNTTIDYFYNIIADNATAGKTTLTYVLTDNNGNEKTQAVDLIGANGVTISSVSGDNFTSGGAFIPNATKQITITGDSYTLSKTVASNTATLTLASSDTNKASSNIEILGKNNITIGTENNKITISAVDTYVNSLSFLNAANSGNGFVLAAGYNNSANEITATFDPIVSLNGTADYHFVNGKANIPVYTRDQVDILVRQLNSMTFMGVIGTGQLLTQVPNGTTVQDTNGVVRQVAIGDTYKIGSGQVTIPTGSSSTVTVGVGDQIIAQGTEYTQADYDNHVINDTSLIGKINPATLYWAYIPSGDDTVTINTYIGAAIPGGITLLENPSGNEIAKFVVKGDNNYITIDSAASTGTNQEVTIKHNLISTAIYSDITSTSVISQSANSQMTIPVITQINRDAAGHVQNIVVSNYRVTDTVGDISYFNTSVSGDSNHDYANIETRIVLSSNNQEVSTAVANFVMESETLRVSTATKTIGTKTYNSVLMDIIWGSF